jgi:hypothetical protein
VSNFGQAALTIGGFALFGPVGYLVGSYLGQALFPTKLPTVRGPRLEDAKVQTSSLGAPIYWVWGTYILAGQVIWKSPFLERKIKEKSGGKGGPEQTSIHYEYRVNVAIGLCRGPIAGVRRIWADTKLIYDATAPTAAEAEDLIDVGEGEDGISAEIARLINRAAASTAAAAKFDLYLGTEVQEPDATIESYEEVGNVSAYRGLAYIVFRDFELAEYGNRVPNFRVEVFTDGDVGDQSVDLYSNDVIYPWLDGFTRDPRNPLNGHEYSSNMINQEAGWTDSLTTTLEERGDDVGRELVPDILWRWSKGGTPTTVSWCDGEDANDNLRLYLWYNSLNIPGDDCDEWTSCASILTGKGAGVVFHARNAFLVVTESGVPESYYFDGYSQSGNSPCGDDQYRQFLTDHSIRVRRTRTPPSGCAGMSPVPGAPGYCVTEDGVVVPEITWVLTPGTWNVLRNYADNGGRVTSYPLNPARPSTHAQYNDQAFWEAAYAEAVAAGDIEAGLVYGVDYPESQAYGYVGSFAGDSADLNTVTLASIVSDICNECGLTSHDVSDLETTLVHGYALTAPMTGKDAIDPLRPFGYFDAVESEFEYKFVQRGHDSVKTIDTADLAARLSTEERPPAISVSRAQDQELPRLVRAHFIDLTRDGDPGQAEQQRQTVDSVNSVDLQVPVVMSTARGQAMVDTVLFERWIGRNTYQCSVPFLKYAELEPTDCIDVTVDGAEERMRIINAEARALAVMNITAVRDDASVYSGLDIVGEATGGSTLPLGNVPSPTQMILLELPSLRAQDTDCGYYAAARGLLPGWPGAIVYRATSTSGTFRQVAWTSIAATIGTVTDSAGVDTISDSGVTGSDLIDTAGIDQSTVIRVQLYSGSFESVTEADLLAGENLIAVGTEGDWELIRFQIAVQGTDGVWELSNLLRSQYDTAQRNILEGERVVLMSGPGIMRIDESAAVSGIERVLRAVTSGTSLEDADDHYITTTCLSLTTSGGAATAADEISSVISRSEIDAPLSPSCDDTYIVADGSPGSDDDWFAHVDDLARWNCETLAWVFASPVIGKLIYVEDEFLYVYWNGTDYVELSTSSTSDTSVLGDFASWGVPYVDFSADLTLSVDHNGRKLIHPSGAGSGDVLTIPQDAVAGFDDSQTTTVINLATQSVTIEGADSSVTLINASDGSSGAVTLADKGICTLTWVTTDTWIVSGSGLT